MVVSSIVSFFASLLTTAALGFAMSSNFWIGFKWNEKSYTSGLWNVCEGGEDCEGYEKWMSDEKEPLWLSQVRVLFVVACISSSLSILSTMLRLYNENVKSYVAALFFFLTAVLTGGGCWLFAERKEYYNKYLLVGIEYQWGFFVACTSASMALAMMVFSTVSYLVVRCRKGEDDVGYGFVSHV